MKAVSTWALSGIFLALLLVFTSPVTSQASEPITTIGTGSINGVYHSAGSAIAKMFNLQRQEFGGWMANQATEGSIDNIESVLEDKVVSGLCQDNAAVDFELCQADDEVDFGISQANFLFDAVNGEGIYAGQPKKDLRAVLGLYIEDLTVIAAVDAGINTAADLKGKRVNIGAPGSSTALTALQVLKELGIEPEDVELRHYPNYAAPERLESNDIDAYIFVVGHPNLSVMEATKGKRKVHIVPIDKPWIDAVAARRPYFSADEINTEYYDGLADKGPVPTIGVRAILFTRADVDEKIVYQVVKQVMSNLDLFRQQHPALANLKREVMSQDLIVSLPLHPGAERYFREVGLIQ